MIVHLFMWSGKIRIGVPYAFFKKSRSTYCKIPPFE